jgi:hypothetical protein
MELLIVVLIIVALMSLLMAATFQVIAGQRRSNSEQLVQTVSRALDRQWKAAIDMSHTEAIPEGVMQMALDYPSGVQNKPRAQVIWTKLVLKREFPCTWADALTPVNLPSYGLTATTVRPVPTYAQKINSVISVGYSANPSTQAAECLYLALRQSRRGEGFDPDSLGSAAIRDTDTNGLPEIVDAWGTPLGFYPFPIGNPEFLGLSGRILDPQDPQGLLLDPRWNNASNPAVAAFETTLHLVHDPNASSWTPKSFYIVPVVASAGKDTALGFDGFDTAPYKDNFETLPSCYSAAWMVTMNPNPPPPTFLPLPPTTYDNIYGYRRFGARGD